jgi:hypothetical protein
MSRNSTKNPYEELSAPAPGSDDTLKNILAELAIIRGKLDKVDLLEGKLDKLQQALDKLGKENEEIRNENRDLKQDLCRKDKIILQLQEGMNSLERHQCAWSVRIHGVPLARDEEEEPLLVMKKIHELVFLPILKGALAAKAIDYIPTPEQLFETAHILPGKAGSHKPIIARFSNRNYKAICFKFRRDYARRVNNTGTRSKGAANGGRPDRLCFPFHDDLPRATLNRMLELQAHKDVQACWSINGNLRFKLKNSETVRRVNSIFEPLDSLFK